MRWELHDRLLGLALLGVYVKIFVVCPTLHGYNVRAWSLDCDSNADTPAHPIPIGVSLPDESLLVRRSDCFL